MKYQAKIDLANKNNSHTLAYDEIIKRANGQKLKILEVGCSTGFFGSALIDCGHEVWGVEPNVSAANEARRVLSYVHNGLIEELFDKHEKVRFDVIVFGDVLEHLVDPITVLQRAGDFINENGLIVASVPNVAHIAIRAMLLEGRWDYSDLGILDRTHLKFYTKNTFIDLFTDTDYRILNIDSVRLSVEQVNDLFKLNLQKNSIDVAKTYASDGCGYDFQYVISADRCSGSERNQFDNNSLKYEGGLKVLCFVGSPDSTLVDIRLRNPLRKWSRTCSGDFRIVPIHNHTAEDLQWGDVFVFQREANAYACGLATYLQENGKNVVFEIDDLLTDLPPFLSHHEKILKHSRKHLLDLMNKSDALSVSTENLKIKYQDINNNIYVVPNYSEPLGYQATHEEVPPDKVQVVVASSDKVMVDMLVDPLLELQIEYNVRVICIGPIGVRLSECGVVVQRHEIMAHNEFKRFVGSLDNAIGIIPLENSEFSSCKSAIKYFDYSLAGIPCVCSNVPPYSDVITDGINGFLVKNTTRDWRDKIIQLIEKSGLRRSISNAAYEHVIDHHNIADSANQWNKLITSLGIEKNTPDSIAEYSFKEKTNYSSVVKWIVRNAIRPASYVRAFEVIRDHGLIGIFQYIRRR